MTDYSELKRLALASLECQYPDLQEAHDLRFEEAATPGAVWLLIEKYEALVQENARLTSSKLYWVTEPGNGLVRCVPDERYRKFSPLFVSGISL